MHGDTDEGKKQIDRSVKVFTLRMWREDLGEGRMEWRGSLSYLLTGEVRYFRGVNSLYRALLVVLDCAPPSSAPSTPTDRA